MRVEVKVPQLSESVAEATLLSWNFKVGEAVKQGQNLIDIETDKVMMELPAPGNGVLAEIVRDAGSAVKSGELIAVIDTEAVASAPAPAAAAAPAQPAAAAPAGNGASNGAAAAPQAMPAAAKLMSEQGIAAADVNGTGRGGRITKGDVLAHAGGAAAAPASQTGTQPSAEPAARPAAPAVPQPQVALAAGRSANRVPMTRLRSRVAERLVESQQGTATLTTFNEVNMAPVMELRKRYGERFEKDHGVKLGFMGFFVKAACAALKKFPVVNASVDGNDIVYHNYCDVGIAVSSPRGLVVPILRDADQMSIAQIEKTIVDFGNRARDGKLGLDDLSGGTFSISNGGVFGSMLSTPIINPPQSAILGIHATKERAVVENGQVVVRPMNYLALSYDHRIIDGREAVLTLVAIKDALEDPARLLLEI
ncbi:MAG: 2-oxoglutarate dehydrogenase complex dihydrolipoyllysine-residue succinyltransferase [Rhodocyclaceae bacterium]|nr:2-oxoglutarate dehydrogenase complex dihydrolipoyllysine-residue succinyltransferase [Rhodocyclaceae bacterium]